MSALKGRSSSASLNQQSAGEIWSYWVSSLHWDKLSSPLNGTHPLVIAFALRDRRPVAANLVFDGPESVREDIGLH